MTVKIFVVKGRDGSVMYLELLQSEKDYSREYVGYETSVVEVEV